MGFPHGVWCAYCCGGQGRELEGLQEGAYERSWREERQGCNAVIML